MKKNEESKSKEVLKNDELIVIKGGNTVALPKDCEVEGTTDTVPIMDCDNAS